MSKVSNAPIPEQTGSQTGGLLLGLQDIYVDPTRNLRRFAVDEKDIADLMLSIQTNGQIQPVVVEHTVQPVKEVPEGVDPESIPEPPQKPPYTLVAGYNRFKALTAIQDKTGEPVTVQASLRNGVAPDKNHNLDAKLVNLHENIRRKDLSHMDLATAIGELRQEGLLDKDIAKHIGKSATFVSEVAKFNDLEEKYQKKIHTGEIPFKLARELSRVAPEEREAMVSAAKAAKDAGENQSDAAQSVSGRKKAKRKKKDAKSEKKGLSAKGALLLLEQQGEALEPEEGKKQTKQEESVAAVFAMFKKFLGGGMGVKALQNRLLELF